MQGGYFFASATFHDQLSTFNFQPSTFNLQPVTGEPSGEACDGPHPLPILITPVGVEDLRAAAGTESTVQDPSHSGFLGLDSIGFDQVQVPPPKNPLHIMPFPAEPLRELGAHLIAAASDAGTQGHRQVGWIAVRPGQLSNRPSQDPRQSSAPAGMNRHQLPAKWIDDQNPAGSQPS